jgi:hypothetical protein
MDLEEGNVVNHSIYIYRSIAHISCIITHPYVRTYLPLVNTRIGHRMVHPVVIHPYLTAVNTGCHAIGGKSYFVSQLVT